MKLELKDINVYAQEKHIVKGVNLSVSKNQIHVIMGPNGSGKSTLIYGLLKHPRYQCQGQILLNNEDISKLKTYELAKHITACFQDIPELEGIKLRQLLWSIAKEKYNITEFNQKLNELLNLFHFNKSDLQRSSGFSGGEKKRIELMQIMLMKPEFILIDEIDSGVDVDNIKIISEAINQLKKETGIILITHYGKLIDKLDVDFVHIYHNGKIIKTGNKQLAKEIEEFGFSKHISE